MSYYKEVVEYENRVEFTIHERGRGASGDVLAVLTDRVFADRIVDLLNEDEAITQLIGNKAVGAVTAMLETALEKDA